MKIKKKKPIKEKLFFKSKKKCPECNGDKGYIVIYGSGCGGDDWVKCDKCKGTGLLLNN